jgi:CelD/BcsL family acetyltransferase involved in cellulose biosynthesis
MISAARPLLRAFDATPAREQDGAAVQAGKFSFTITDNLAAVERDWRDFERHADGTVFQTFAWLSTWQRHIGSLNDVRPVIVTVRDGAGGILCLLPLAIQPRRFARELVWLGSDLCDYNGPLLASDFAQRVGPEGFLPIWRRITAALRGHPSLRYDLVRLEKMAESVGTQANPFLALPVRRHSSGAWLTPLAENWETFYAAKRSSTTRRRDRAKRKKLAGLGELALVEPSAPAERLRSLNTLMEQKARNFARMGMSNLFARPGHAAFYRALATNPETASIVHVSELDVGPHAAAINLGLIFRHRYYHLLASYTDDQDIARFGPGTAHLNDLLALAMRRGFTIFDFTIGDEAYKRDWCESRQILHDYLWARTPAGLAVALPLALKQRLKRLIKENAMLWSAALKTRAALARLAGRAPDIGPQDDDRS